jgi:hypothetical protein
LNGLAVDASAIGKAQYAEETAYAIFELDWSISIYRG